ncbi:MAG TPA: phospholipase D-like domain-containing protein, partial [Solirubrobacteraceae bacterium]|nr:phospholipase D-like domain-containing protein [Solirubrobacteraceae bacterium]
MRNAPRSGRTQRHRASRAALAALIAATLAGCSGLNPMAATNPSAPDTVPAPALLTEPGQIAPIYTALNSARRTIDMTMYELEDPTAERALAAAARRGVDVRVLLDGGYYGSGAPANAGAFAYLRAHNVQVRWSPSYFALTHQKTITIDRRRSLVMTLNL